MVKIEGSTSKVANVDITSPPITARPSGACIWLPSLQRQGHRHHAHGHRTGGHQDRPQPVARADDGRIARGRLLPSSVRP